jgi:phage-related protein
MDECIKQGKIEYNAHEQDMRISQEEEDYAEESEKIDREITLQRRRVDQVKFEIKCKISHDTEARKKRKRDEEINEKRIIHKHFLEIKYKNDEIYSLRLRMEENH